MFSFYLAMMLIAENDLHILSFKINIRKELLEKPEYKMFSNQILELNKLEKEYKKKLSSTFGTKEQRLDFYIKVEEMRANGY